MSEYIIEQQVMALKDSLRRRLKYAADDIINKEIDDILGRVKIITTRDLNDGFSWIIEPKQKEIPLK